MTATAPPAGWYDDPEDPSATWRWWDGTTWTTYTGPKQAEPDAAPAAASVTVDTAADTTVATTVATRLPTLDDAAREAAYREQMQYHSAAFAEPSPVARPAQDVPRERNFPQRSSVVEQLAPPPVIVGSPLTAGGWVMALAPIIFTAVGILGVVVGAPDFAPFVVTVPIALIAGIADIRRLRWQGYERATYAWLVWACLVPLIYMLLRGRVVRAAGGKPWPLELTYVIGVILVVATRLVLVGLIVGGGLFAAAPSGQPAGDYFAGAVTGTGDPRAQAEAVLTTYFRHDDPNAVVVCDHGGVASGLTFACDLVMLDSRAPFDVTWTTSGEIWVTVPDPIGSDGGASQQQLVEDMIATDLGGGATVDCSASAALIVTDSTFVCQATIDGGTYPATVTITEKGDIVYEVEVPSDVYDAHVA